MTKSATTKRYDKLIWGENLHGALEHAYASLGTPGRDCDMTFSWMKRTEGGREVVTSKEEAEYLAVQLEWYEPQV